MYLEIVYYFQCLSCRMANEFRIFILTDGMDGNVLKIKPPVCIVQEDVDYFIASLDKILNTLSS